MKRTSYFCLAILVSTGASAQSKLCIQDPIWQDEFSDETLDPEKWNIEQNCWGGGNHELQCYVNDKRTISVANGVLSLTALKEQGTGPTFPKSHPNYDPAQTSTKSFISGRINSKSKAAFTYGRFEIRAKLPQGQGSWPAIWMLPEENRYGPWPESGEIDIMEAVNLGARSDDNDASYEGKPETRVHGTLHYGTRPPKNVYTGKPYRLDDERSPSSGFHVYRLDWKKDEISWYVDGVLYSTQYPQMTGSDGWFSQPEGNTRRPDNAPFNHPFHLLLNVAVGGDWASKVNEKGVDESKLPFTMQIDWVRVYELCD